MTLDDLRRFVNDTADFPGDLPLTGSIDARIHARIDGVEFGRFATDLGDNAPEGADVDALRAIAGQPWVSFAITDTEVE